jgi:hypothetical protein
MMKKVRPVQAGQKRDMSALGMTLDRQGFDAD